jgi:sugar O-acyltransferase (sialic acid O-acetyltransferase NeuD family)
MLAGWAVRGFYDDEPHAVAARALRLAHLGTLASVPACGTMADRFVLCLGDLALRAKTLERLGRCAANVIHPACVLHASAELGVGIYVGPRAVIHSFARVADHAIINTGAIVEHECEIGSNVHIAPGAVLAGRVKVGPGTLVGLNATVLPSVRVGASCVIGAGAVVTKDVPDGTTVIGVPASAR